GARGGGRSCPPPACARPPPRTAKHKATPPHRAPQSHSPPGSAASDRPAGPAPQAAPPPPSHYERDELAPSHSITSSALACKVRGSLIPSVLAVLRLRTNWTLMDCSTGNSAGFSPFRMRPT